ncbi:MAG: DUF2029 domain-containing protein [Lachnospiraceae bacterium]|nr:DUF2029 domain-containing protein [Lachnospiraceae bacterium]
MIRKLRSIHVFFGIALGMALFSACYLVKTHGSALDMVVFADGRNLFMDFFNHITYVRNPEEVYFVSPQASFPPLVYGMYYFFGIILPADATVMNDVAATSSYALLLYVIYCVVLAVLLFYSVYKLLWKRGVSFSLAVTLMIILSNVFIFSVVERGNSVLIVCILLMRALELREHDDRVKSELALILIALAAGIKMYPAVFGLLYIYEKRWKEAGRLIIYGILGFFVPFVFFGGIRGLKQFLLNHKILQSSGNDCCSITSLWDKIYYDLMADNIPIELGWLGVSLAAFFFGMVILSGWLCEDYYKRILLLTSAMILVPFLSGDYTIIYMALPMCFFLREESACVKTHVLYALIFSLFIYDNPTLRHILGTPLPTAMAFLCVYIMSILTIVVILRQHKSVKLYKNDLPENV